VIRMKCSGCGSEGKARDSYAGRKVTCKRCGVLNAVPDSVSLDADWIAEITPRGGSVSREVDMHDLAMATASWAD
jgi:hypothetical protein